MKPQIQSCKYGQYLKYRAIHACATERRPREIRYVPSGTMTHGAPRMREALYETHTRAAAHAPRATRMQAPQRTLTRLKSWIYIYLLMNHGKPRPMRYAASPARPPVAPAPPAQTRSPPRTRAHPVHTRAHPRGRTVGWETHDTRTAYPGHVRVPTPQQLAQATTGQHKCDAQTLTRDTR